MSEEFALVKKDKKFLTLDKDLQSVIENHLFSEEEAAAGDFIGDGRWSPVFVKLVQKEPPFSTEEIKLGDIVGNGKLERPVKVIPLTVWQSRTKWHDGQVWCKSADSKVPSMENPEGHSTCRECPYSGKNCDREVKCKLSFNIGALGGDFHNVYIFQFSGASFMTGLNMYKMSKGKGPLYSASFNLDTERKSNKGLTWYQYSVINAEETPEGLFPVLEICQAKLVEYVTELMARGATAEDATPKKKEDDEDDEVETEVTEEEIEKAKKMGLT